MPQRFDCATGRPICGFNLAISDAGTETWAKYDIIRYHMISYDIYSIDCDPEVWALSGPLGLQTCRSFRFDHFCTEVVPTSPLACTWCNGTQAQGLIPDAVFLGGILGRCGQWCEIFRKGCTVDIPSGNLTLPWKINSSNKSK